MVEQESWGIWRKARVRIWERGTEKKRTASQETSPLSVPWSGGGPGRLLKGQWAGN